jgi:hypothetical protein
MRKINVLLLLIVAFVLSAAYCEGSQLGQVGDYTDGAITSVDIIKDTDMSGDTASDVKNITDSAIGVTAIVTKVVPGAQVYGAAIIAVLTTIGGIASFITGRKQKKRADDYGNAIEVAIKDGDDVSTIKTKVLGAALPGDTRDHFNSKGIVKL